MKKTKKYIISESQYKNLLEIKKNEKKIINNIFEEISKIKNLKEKTIINEGVYDIINKYHKRGVLTSNIIDELSKKGVKIKNKLN